MEACCDKGACTTFVQRPSDRRSPQPVQLGIVIRMVHFLHCTAPVLGQVMYLPPHPYKKEKQTRIMHSFPSPPVPRTCCTCRRRRPDCYSFLYAPWYCSIVDLGGHSSVIRQRIRIVYVSNDSRSPGCGILAVFPIPWSFYCFLRPGREIFCVRQMNPSRPPEIPYVSRSHIRIPSFSLSRKYDTQQAGYLTVSA